MPVCSTSAERALGRGALLEQRVDRRNAGARSFSAYAGPMPSISSMSPVRSGAGPPRRRARRAPLRLLPLPPPPLRGAASAAAALAAKSFSDTLLWPAAMPSASARTISEHERIASSFPGITNCASSGSQFVSTSAITGRCRRCASRTASASFFRSTMKIASGWRFMSATPPRFASSFSSSASIVIRSLAGSSASWPSFFRRRRSWRYAIRSEIVRQFVSRPPSQRFGDERHADARRLGAHGVLRLLLRADEQDRAAALGDVAREVVRVLDELLRLLQVDDVDAAALGEDETLHLRVPATCLVAEVNSSLQQLLHGDDCQRDQPLSVWFRMSCSGGPGRNRAPIAEPRHHRPGADRRVDGT